MNILAIETSCDDTGLAIVKKGKDKIELLSNIVSSQIQVHAPYGGVVPNLAARAHLENIKPCLESALEKANNPEIDLIAVTVGPGLIPSLQIGVNFAKSLAYAWQKPIIGINHIEGHIYANWIKSIPRITQDSSLRYRSVQNDENKTTQNNILFPALCLIVSGGHTQLVLMEDHNKYKSIGQTKDDAAGEAFDKVAKLLGLGYPGGPLISKFAEEGDKNKFDLPRPMMHTNDFDFSFSGLKTAVLYEVRGKSTELPHSPNGSLATTQQYIKDMSASFQQAVIDVLIHKTIKATEKYKVKTVMLAGGVTANKELRQQITKQVKEKLSNIEIQIPEIQFCTDNAAMIAAAACFKNKKERWQDILANANLKF